MIDHLNGTGMVRTLDRTAHSLRRDEFIDVAQRLLQAKGYEGMSVQDVLDELDASKGAFYHYFDSKQALLEAVVERMVDTALVSVAPIVADATLPAAAKVEGVFHEIARMKAEQKELVLALLQVWLADDNAIVREKFRRGIAFRLAPVLATIVRQGNAEGAFSAASPDEVGRLLVSFILSVNEVATDLFVARQANAIPYEVVERTFAAYGESFERILGARPGSLAIVDSVTLRQWYG
jgi:AcrR family transcriptional regulator